MNKQKSRSDNRPQANNTVLDVLIIGAGFSGICAGYHLLKRGIDNFTILEQTSGIGGTWYKNRYPGAACDVPSHFYCFSFAPNPNWTHVYSGQEEIQAYIEKCAHDFGLLPHIRFNISIEQLVFDPASEQWSVTLPDGGELKARHLIIGSGGLNMPNVPELKGLDEFAGPAFHTAEWPENIDLKDKNIVVIGSAASAVQAVPVLAKTAKKLTMFQRTPNYIVARRDREYSETEKMKFRNSSLRLKFQRLRHYLRFEYILSPMFKKKSWIRKKVQEEVKAYIKGAVKDPVLAEKLIPNYEIGCKRILISDDFYPALDRSNVEVNTHGIDHIEKGAVIDGKGDVIDADVLVLATGFDMHKQMLSIELVGRNGTSLKDRWSKAAEAYMGCMVDEFPNAYFVTGPNTGVGSTSVVHMIEAQVKFIMKIIDIAGQGKLIEPTKEALQDDNNRTQTQLQDTVWAGSCTSWYKDEEGRIHTLYPHAARYFRKDRKRLNLKEFLITERRFKEGTPNVT